MKRILPLILMFLFAIPALLNAQTLVNKAWQDTTGNPQDTLSLQFTLRDGHELLTVGNTYATSDSEQVLITKYSSTGTRIWQVKIASADTKRLIATGVDISNGYIYLASSAYDSATNSSTFVTYKLNDSTGSTVWTKQYTPSFGGYAVPAAVREDSLGNVFVAGTEQVNDTSYEMTLLKYNSSGTLLFTSHYDSTGLYSGAVGMGAPVFKDSAIAITGYSGKTFGTWDIVSMQANINSGGISSVSRVSNGTGSFISHPVALAQDGQHSTYVVGASETDGPNIDIKLIKYDSLFNQVWIKTWGNPDSLNDQPTYMVMDSLNNLIVTGYTTLTSGEVDLLVLKYDHNGNLLWSRTFNYGNGLGRMAQGNSVITDNNNVIYVTGKVYNGNSFDIPTIAYDDNGNLLWEKFYDDGTGSNDNGANISIDNTGNVYVSGAIQNSASSRFITMQYQQWSATPCKTTPCPDITYTFANGQLTASGADTFLEFDIYALQNTPSLKFSGADLYFTYNKNVFGPNVVDSGRITVTRGTITTNTNYSFSERDTMHESDVIPASGEEVHLSITSADTTHLFFVADTFQQLCHIKMKRKTAGYVAVRFDQFFMQNASEFYSAASTSYTYVATSKELTLALGGTNVYYSMSSVTGTSTSIIYNIEVTADASGPVGNAYAYMTYNTGALTLNNIAVAYWFPEPNNGPCNDDYCYSATSNGDNSGSIFVQITSADGTYDPNNSDAHTFPTNGQKETYVQVKFDVNHCDVDPMILFNLTQMQTPPSNNAFWDAGSSNFINYTVNATGNYDGTNCATGIKDIDSILGTVVVYPNPFTDNFILKLNLSMPAIVDLTIENFIGQKIYSTSLGKISSGETQKVIEFPGEVSKGVYFIDLKINNTLSIIKIIKE